MAGPTILKISVLSNGELFLDGHTVTPEILEANLRQGALESAVVWYYRENPAGEAPPVAKQVIELIARNRLPVRLSARPDFSDAVAPPPSKAEQVFAGVRQRAAQRQLVVVRADYQCVLLPALSKDAVPASALATVERLLPSTVQRKVAVIGDTRWSEDGKPNVQAANRAVPFFGLLMGLATIGHAVWIFDGSLERLAAGCRDADVLIVDSARLELLPEAWETKAAEGMRRPQILVHDRATNQLRKA
jgi:hypothetical protein